MHRQAKPKKPALGHQLACYVSLHCDANVDRQDQAQEDDGANRRGGSRRQEQKPNAERHPEHGAQIDLGGLRGHFRWQQIDVVARKHGMMNAA